MDTFWTFRFMSWVDMLRCVKGKVIISGVIEERLIWTRMGKNVFCYYLPPHPTAPPPTYVTGQNVTEIPPSSRESHKPM